MIIQLNADKNLSISNEYSEKLEGIIKNELDRFVEILTRVEMFFSDENSSRETSNDKKCTLEARIKNKQPLAVSALGDTYDQALNTAIHKLKNALETIVGKMRSH